MERAQLIPAANDYSAASVPSGKQYLQYTSETIGRRKQHCWTADRNGHVLMSGRESSQNSFCSREVGSKGPYCGYLTLEVKIISLYYAVQLDDESKLSWCIGFPLYKNNDFANLSDNS